MQNESWLLLLKNERKTNDHQHTWRHRKRGFVACSVYTHATRSFRYRHLTTLVLRETIRIAIYRISSYSSYSSSMSACHSFTLFGYIGKYIALFELCTISLLSCSSYFVSFSSLFAFKLETWNFTFTQNQNFSLFFHSLLLFSNPSTMYWHTFFYDTLTH